MKVGLVTVAYNEERFIEPFLNHIPKWVDENLVLVSSVPWEGKTEIPDDTDIIAEKLGATVIINNWKTEQDQRNAGQDYFYDMDWVIVMDPDEFLDHKGWRRLRRELSKTTASALIVQHQRVFWKDKEVSPHSDYQQLIAVRPHVRFVDKRVVASPFQVIPVELYHFSWARTDDEVYTKITHYAHAHDFDTQKWFEEVWMSDKQENLHPVTPSTLAGLVEPKLPREIEELELCP